MTTEVSFSKWYGNCTYRGRDPKPNTLRYSLTGARQQKDRAVGTYPSPLLAVLLTSGGDPMDSSRVGEVCAGECKPGGRELDGEIIRSVG